MNKAKIMLMAFYAASFVLIVSIILLYTWINNRLDADLIIENARITSNFIEKVQAEKISTEEYVKIFKAQFEYQASNNASKKSLIELNSSIGQVFVLLVGLQLFFITLYVVYGRKSEEVLRL